MIGAGVRDSCGKSESRVDPQAQKAPRRLPDRRGKRVPGVEIDVRDFTNPHKTVDKLDFHHLKYVRIPVIGNPFF
ncbi:hypothetical protein RCO48_25005 [Peribacillus frigoritolerans]|nr:hypothetical protein [Peribacillus frigoritolerans]